METINGFIMTFVEMRFTPTGTAITNFKICEDKEQTNHFFYSRINVWAELGELANEILEAFDYVYLKGYWKERIWMGQDGKEHNTKEFTARQIWIKENEEFFELNEELKTKENFSRYNIISQSKSMDDIEENIEELPF
jgi:single-stranded DNA-binding protein